MATATATASNTPFTWEGTDRTGKKVKGKVVSTSEAAVRTELRRQGVVPTRVRKQSVLFRKQGRVTAADIAIFSRQLATMMTAYSVVNALCQIPMGFLVDRFGGRIVLAAGLGLHGAAFAGTDAGAIPRTGVAHRGRRRAERGSRRVGGLRAGQAKRLHRGGARLRAGAPDLIHEG